MQTKRDDGSKLSPPLHCDSSRCLVLVVALVLWLIRNVSSENLFNLSTSNFAKMRSNILKVCCVDYIYSLVILASQ